MSQFPSLGWRFAIACAPLTLTSLGLASLASAQELQQAPPQHQLGTPIDSADTPRPTRDAGWFVLIRPEGQARAATIQRLAQLRGEIAMAPKALDKRAEFAALVTSLEKSSRQAAAAAMSVARAAGAEVGEPDAVLPGFYLGNASDQLVATLAARDDVLDVQKLRWQLPATATAMNAAHHDGVGANALVVAGETVTGKGIGIAVLDSGLDLDMNGSGRPHAAFYANGVAGDLSGGGIIGSRIQENILVHPDFYAITSFEDIHGHGTRVASTIAGAKWSSGLDVGHAPAWDADLYNLKISDDGIAGAPATTLAMSRALTEAILHPDIRIANLSYDGHNDPGYFLNRKIDEASNLGVLVTQ
ncbi:MAG: S8 family serine peptidase [Planctomycetes bacterium]|nr:S8 family serine peptidase [Planctomycetota bacterium]